MRQTPQSDYRPIARYRFAPEILAEARAVSKPDNWHGPLAIAEHWFWIAFWCAAAFLSWQHAPLWVSLPVYVVAVYFIGGRQRAIAGVLHMATHRALMRDHRIGSVLGAVLGGYPVLQSFTGYRASHLGEHHGRLGDPDRDPDYQQYQRYGLCGEDLGRPALRRHLWKMLSPQATASYIAYLVRHRIVTAGERPIERWIRAGLLAGVLAWAVLGGWWPYLILYWFVPLVTTQVWLGSFAELLEHFPLIENAPRTDIYMSWNRVYGFWLRFLTGEEQGEGYHLVHHLFPRTPMWRLRQVDTVLRRDPVYADLPSLGGVFGGLRQIYLALPEQAQAAVPPGLSASSGYSVPS